MDKDCTLPKEKLKNLTERLRGALRLSGVDNIVTKSRTDNWSGVTRSCQVSLEYSLLVDYDGNTAL